MIKSTVLHYVTALAAGMAAFGLPMSAPAQTMAPPAADVIYDTDRLSTAFHKNRRDSVMAVLPVHAVAVFLSAPVRNRENDVNYEYRQSSDLYYLTGTEESNSVLLLVPGAVTVDGTSVTELLLVPPRNPTMEIWTGRLLGPERAAERFGIGTVVTIDRFDEIVGPLLADNSRRLYHLPLPAEFDARSPLGRQIALLEAEGDILQLSGNPMLSFAMNRMLATNTDEALQQNQRLIEQRIGAEPFQESDLEHAYDKFLKVQSAREWQDWKHANIDAVFADGSTLRARLDELRMAKTPEELTLLGRAIDITVAAHREVMKSIEPGMYEYEAEALIEYVFRRNGAESPGFPSIVGSGENSVVLHYETNRRRMTAGDLVVMDVGAEYHGYSADVTRTVPVSGTFSTEQRAIYEIVLAAQQAGITSVRAGLPFRGIHQAAFRVVADGLHQLGLVESDQEVRRFFMHGTSHHIGLYVHDVSSGGDLVPGAVLTVEPGIYISPADDIDPKWWNIGVRIEDDVLVTDGGPIVLSAAAPRTVAEVEALMSEQGLGNDRAGVVGSR